VPPNDLHIQSCRFFSQPEPSLLVNPVDMCLHVKPSTGTKLVLVPYSAWEECMGKAMDFGFLKSRLSSGHRLEPYIRSSYMVTHVVTLVVCLLTASRRMKNAFCFLFHPIVKHMLRLQKVMPFVAVPCIQILL